MDTVHAAYHTEFDEILKKLNLFEPDGSIKTLHCKFCRQIVTQDNILSVFPQDGQICVCCERIACQNALMELTT